MNEIFTKCVCVLIKLRFKQKSWWLKIKIRQETENEQKVASEIDGKTKSNVVDVVMRWWEKRASFSLSVLCSVEWTMLIDVFYLSGLCLLMFEKILYSVLYFVCSTSHVLIPLPITFTFKVHRSQSSNYVHSLLHIVSLHSLSHFNVCRCSFLLSILTILIDARRGGRVREREKNWRRKTNID